MTERHFPSGSRDAEATAEGQGLSLLDILFFFARHKHLLFVLPVLATIGVLAITLFMPPWYSATAKILPAQQNQSNALAMLGQLGGLAGGPMIPSLGLKSPTDIHVAILKSRTIADKIIDRFDLRTIYGEKSLQDARQELARNVVVQSGRDGVIAVDVHDKDPKRAADMANAYVEELRNLSSQLAVSEAGQRRLFFEAQLGKAKNDLAKAEVELKQFTQTSGLVNPQAQLSLSVGAAATLRAQIAAKEIQLSAMRSFATESNPAVSLALRELAALRSELAKMERDAPAQKGDVMVPFGKAPEVGLEYLRKYRDVKYFETLFEVLSRQYEIARIDEARDSVLVQMLDQAVPPERSSRPKRAQVVLLTFFSAVMVGLVCALIREALWRASLDPERANRLRELFSLLGWRRKR